MINEPAKIFITGFPIDIRSRHIENLFENFGRVIFSDISKGAGCIVINFICFK